MKTTQIFTHNKSKYVYFMFDILGLCEWLLNNDKFEIALVNLMSDHRKRSFSLLNFVTEYLNGKSKRNEETYYFFICNEQHEIITISRAHCVKKLCELSAVYTSAKYRKQGFCQKNIKRLMKMMKYYFGTKEFKLYVKKDNIPALSCYEKAGFQIVKTINVDKIPHHVMLSQINRD